MLRSVPDLALCGVLLLLAGVPARSARAQTPGAGCDAVATTEPLRSTGHFREAHALLLECVNAQCGGDVRRHCAAVLQKLDAVTPSIVIRAEDAQGNDITEVVVNLDGKALVRSLDGMATPVDPGEHLLSLERPGRPAVSQRFVIKEAEKFRSIDVHLESAPPPDTALPTAKGAERAAAGSGRLAVEATLIGVGVAGLGGFTWLGLNARSRESDLKECRPACSPGRVDSVRKRYVLSNVSLGVGVVALGSATWLLLTGSPKKALAEPRDLGLEFLAGPGVGFATYAHPF
jgi:hypothetical protein